MASSDPRPLKKAKFPDDVFCDPVEALPEDLVVRIFSLVSRERWASGIAIFPLVSKSWNAACRKPGKLWESLRLDLREYDDIDPECEAGCLAWLGQRLPAVELLCVYLRNGDFCTAFWTTLPSLLLASRLTTLDVSWAHHLGGLTTGLCSLSELRKLVLTAYDSFHSPRLALPPEINALSKLEVLRFPYFRLVRYPGSTLPLLAPLPALKMLELDLDLDRIVSFPESLTGLCLRSNGFSESLIACSGLQHLRLGGMNLTTDSAQEVLDLMAKNLKHLRRLDLGSVGEFHDHFFQLTTIRVLHLKYELEYAAESEQAARAFLSRLEVLSLPKADRTILASLHSLRVLDLSSLRDPDQIRARDITSLPKLQELFLPAVTFEPEDLHQLSIIVNKRRDMEVYFGSPVDCDFKEDDCLAFGYAWSPWYEE